MTPLSRLLALVQTLSPKAVECLLELAERFAYEDERRTEGKIDMRIYLNVGKPRRWPMVLHVQCIPGDKERKTLDFVVERRTLHKQ